MRPINQSELPADTWRINTLAGKRLITSDLRLIKRILVVLESALYGVLDGAPVAEPQTVSGAHSFKAVLRYYDGTSETLWFDVRQELK